MPRPPDASSVVRLPIPWDEQCSARVTRARLEPYDISWDTCDGL